MSITPLLCLLRTRITAKPNTFYVCSPSVADRSANGSIGYQRAIAIAQAGGAANDASGIRQVMRIAEQEQQNPGGLIASPSAAISRSCLGAADPRRIRGAPGPSMGRALQ